MCWDVRPSISPYVTISSDMRRASMRCHWAYRGFVNIASAVATDEFTVEISGSRFAMNPGYVRIGFVTLERFAPNTCLLYGSGVYTIIPCCGLLSGCGKINAVYCSGFYRGTVRGVVDRVHKTISFHVDGVDHGVAWTGVDPGTLLYAVAAFEYDRVSVEFV